MIAQPDRPEKCQTVFVLANLLSPSNYIGSTMAAGFFSGGGGGDIAVTCM